MSVVPERCSARSQARDEPLLGTASTVRSWLLLEHVGPWGERPLLDARLPAGLGDELRRIERELGVRSLLIRRPDRDVPPSGTCFAIRSGPDDAWIERTRLDRPADVLDLDLASLARGERPGLEAHEGCLFLVCTHGRHDPCCAERGRPLAQWLSVARPHDTWESTHVGGDRFAGNIVAFPHGWYFGRVGHDAGSIVANAYADGRIDLRHARGRSCFPIDVQAAELFLRTQRGLDAVDDVSVASVSRAGSRSSVTFHSRDGRFSVVVERSVAEPMRLTCHAARERAAPSFELVAVDATG